MGKNERQAYLKAIRSRYRWAARKSKTTILELALLRADSNPIGYGAAHNVWQGIGVVCGFEFQPGALGILLQQAQPFQAAACTLADQVDQILQLALVRRPDALKPGRSVIAIDVYAIQEKDMKVYVE
jgi:hypothetical protein